MYWSYTELILVTPTVPVFKQSLQIPKDVNLSAVIKPPQSPA